MGAFFFKMERVTKCGCGRCGVEETIVKGMVLVLNARCPPSDDKLYCTWWGVHVKKQSGQCVSPSYPHILRLREIPRGLWPMAIAL